MSPSPRDARQPPIDFGRTSASNASEPAHERPEERASDAPRVARPPVDGPTRRALILLGIIAAVGIAQIGFLAFVEADRSLRHRTAIGQLEAEVGELQIEADGLRAVAERADDVAYREQLARRQGFLYPDETRVIVLDPDRER